MTASLPPLESLRVLASCVRHRSFSAAARELCLTPSAVSLRMRQLEAMLGVVLFVRHGPRLDVTPHGVDLAASIDDALVSIRSAVERCRRTRRALRVTCAPTFASRWLVPRLAAYHALPDSQPVLLDATDALLPPDRFDVAIRAGRGPWRGFDAVELLRDEGTPMLSPALAGDVTSLSPRRLIALPLIADARWPAWFERAGIADAKPTFAATRFATYELEAIAAAEGVGVALLSPFLYADLCADGALVAPFDVCVDGGASYWALWREGTPKPAVIAWIEETLARETTQNP